MALTGRAAILAAALCSAAACAVEVKVDFSKEVGPVKPMHAVGQPPLLGLRDYQLFRLLKEAGVPYARLHDLGIRARLVDIPHVSSRSPTTRVLNTYASPTKPVAAATFRVSRLPLTTLMPILTRMLVTMNLPTPAAAMQQLTSHSMARTSS